MEGKLSQFNPIHYLINPQLIQSYQCIICLQKSINLLRCCTCHKPFCNQCAVDQKAMSNRCPQKCTPGQFKLQLIPQLKLKYKCPFSISCKQILNSTKQFSQHHRTCNYISPIQQQQQRKKQQFKCIKNHHLQILMAPFDSLIKREQCAQCHQFSLLRAKCPNCNEMYCRYCRPLPIFNLKCPIGHQFIKRDIKSMSYRCDICQLSPFILGIQLYDDFICNFGICENCMENLPTFIQQIQYIQNSRNLCKIASIIGSKNQLAVPRQQHTLVILSKPQMSICQWCLKQKLCLKKCEKCKQFYCLNCKKIKIHQNDQCEFGHKFYNIQEKQNSEKMLTSPQQINTNLICSVCSFSRSQPNGHERQFYKDDGCRLTLCEQCLNYAKYYTFQVLEKQISLYSQPCRFGRHVNFFLPYGKQIFYFCSLCKQQKLIRIMCGMCTEPKFYCSACIPPKNRKQCYCRKNLQKLSQHTYQFCAICQKSTVGQDAYICGPCGYEICQACISQQNQHKKQQQLNKHQIQDQQHQQLQPQNKYGFNTHQLDENI